MILVLSMWQVILTAPYLCYFKLSAVWGGHEGSLLLWVFILTCWIFAVAVKSDGLPLDISARVLSVLGMVAVGFASFTLITSSPFETLVD